MRVTQSMLSSNMLRNLSNSYNKMGKLQEQIATGKKVNRPSDDPVTVMKGLGYRMQVDKVHQFQRNIGEVHNWLDNTDDALDHVGSALHRANELVVNGSTDTMTKEDREKLVGELKQLQNQVKDLANTKIGNKYIFSGTKTNTPLVDKDGQFAFVELDAAGDPVLDADGNPVIDENSSFLKGVDIEVFDGITLDVNTSGEIFKEVDDVLNRVITGLENDDITDQESFDQAIGEIQGALDSVLAVRADIGARQNRVDMMTERLDALEVTSTKQMSDNEDVDYKKVITEMITEESIHRAALSVGARIIQPSLVDFLR